MRDQPGTRPTTALGCLLVLLLVTALRSALFAAPWNPAEGDCSLAQKGKHRRQISKVVLALSFLEINISVW